MTKKNSQKNNLQPSQKELKELRTKLGLGQVKWKDLSEPLRIAYENYMMPEYEKKIEQLKEKGLMNSDG